MKETDILNSILQSGSADSSNATEIQIIANAKQSANMLNKSSGIPRIAHHQISRFRLILSTPDELKIFSQFNIRCCLCGCVIGYPCWYFVKEYSVNKMHYFVCFSRFSPEKVSADCLRVK